MTDLLTCLEEYELALLAEQRSQKTISWYGYNIRQFASFLSQNGGDNLKKITTSNIRSYLVYLQTEAQPWEHNEHIISRRKHLSPASIYGAYTALRAFFNFLEREQIIEDNPIKRVRPPRRPKPIYKFLSEDQVRALLGAISGPFKARNEALILLLLDTGLRASEALGLTLDSLDIKGGRAKVMGKGWKERVVPIGFKARRALLKYINRYRPCSGCPEQSHFAEHVFLTQDGRPMTHNALKMVFRRLSKKIGFRVTPHMLRHTFATQYLRNGGDIFTLQRILGHSSLEMVRRYAATLFEDCQRVHERASPVDRLKI